MYLYGVFSWDNDGNFVLKEILIVLGMSILISANNESDNSNLKASNILFLVHVKLLVNKCLMSIFYGNEKWILS